MKNLTYVASRNKNNLLQIKRLFCSSQKTNHKKSILSISSAMRRTCLSKNLFIILVLFFALFFSGCTTDPLKGSANHWKGKFSAQIQEKGYSSKSINGIFDLDEKKGKPSFSTLTLMSSFGQTIAQIEIQKQSLENNKKIGTDRFVRLVTNDGKSFEGDSLTQLSEYAIGWPIPPLDYLSDWLSGNIEHPLTYENGHTSSGITQEWLIKLEKWHEGRPKKIQLSWPSSVSLDETELSQARRIKVRIHLY